MAVSVASWTEPFLGAYGGELLLVLRWKTRPKEFGFQPTLVMKTLQVPFITKKKVTQRKGTPGGGFNYFLFSSLVEGK